MDQYSDFYTLKRLLQNNNLSWHYKTPYNFTGAGRILRDFEGDFFTLQNFTTVFLLAFYIPIFIFGLLGNVVIIASVVEDRNLRKARNCFLLHLAIADLSVTIFCMPAAVGTLIYRLWIYGVFLCKFIVFLQGVAVSVSIFSLTAMSVDRYISLQNPTASQRVSSPTQTYIIVCCMWIVSGIFMGPLIYVRHVDVLKLPNLEVLHFCIEEWPQDRDRQAYGLFVTFVIYLIPAGTVTICYAHIGRALWTNTLQRDSSDSSMKRLISRKRAARMLIVLVIILIVCWLPYSAISLAADISEELEFTDVLPYALWLGHAHSAINPAMYWSLNKSFRQRVKIIMRRARPLTCASHSAISLSEYV